MRGESGRPLAPRGKNEAREAGGEGDVRRRGKAEKRKDTVHSNGVVACKNKLGKKELFLILNCFWNIYEGAF